MHAAWQLKKEIERVTKTLQHVSPSSDDYVTICQNLTRLSTVLTAVVNAEKTD